MTKIADLPTFDMAEHLTTEDEVAAYLFLVLEEGDPTELAHALDVIARASGLTPEARCKALRTANQLILPP